MHIKHKKSCAIALLVLLLSTAADAHDSGQQFRITGYGVDAYQLKLSGGVYASVYYEKRSAFKVGDQVNLEFNNTRGQFIHDTRSDINAKIISLKGAKYPIDRLLSICLSAFPKTTVAAEGCLEQAASRWHRQLIHDTSFLRMELPLRFDKLKNVGHTGNLSPENVHTAVGVFADGVLSLSKKFNRANYYAWAGGSEWSANALGSQIHFDKTQDRLVMSLLEPD